MDEFSRDMMSNLLGNPHSASSSSQRSSWRIDNVRLKVLALFNANPDHFDVVFVANATAGIKLVMESFREAPNGFWYGYHRDAHTSLVGVRETASSGHRCFESCEVENWLDGEEMEFRGAKDSSLKLFAYPAQSNMNGCRLPLNWPRRFRSLMDGGHEYVFTLLDAAAHVSTSPLDLSDVSKAPDFTVLSFYKIFGFPDLGALMVRKEASHVLQHRRYFGGGTVEMVTCNQEQWHIKKEGSIHDQLEDGTLPFHSIVALDNAMNIHSRLFGTLHQVSLHTSFLAKNLYDGLVSLRHSNGRTVCNIYQDPSSNYNNSRTQGPVIAFNLRDKQGAWISNSEVEKLAVIKNIHLRSGGLCNPGGIASSLNLSPWEMKRNFSSGQRCAGDNDIIRGKPSGMIRVSVGAMSTMQDITTFLEFLAEFFVEDKLTTQKGELQTSPSSGFYIETLMVFPIKSCGGWRIPNNITWDIKAEGLAWDREWCLVHQGTRIALSQKRHPKMALLKPSLDFDKGVLRVHYHGAIPPDTPCEIEISLSADPALFYASIAPNECPTSRVCGDTISAQSYASSTITSFFTNILGIPCYLTRFPPSGSGSSMRHAKVHLQTPTSQPLPGTSSPSRRPILLSNESPILTISRSSLNRLNETIKAKTPSGKAASAEVFRANIIIAEDPASPPGIEQPYIEDSWCTMKTWSQRAEDEGKEDERESTVLEVLGPC